MCLAVAGFGFVLAAAVMGLALLLGPIAASGLIGLVLVLAAAVLYRRTGPQAPPKPPNTPPPYSGPDGLAHLSFVIGFVAGRAALRRLSHSHKQ
jgi:uncharacterized membrane protein YfcA